MTKVHGVPSKYNLCFFDFLLNFHSNSLGHVGTVSYPKHTFPGQALPKVVNQ